MLTGLISEIAFSNGHICMRPSVFANTRDILLANIDAREAAVTFAHKKICGAMHFGADGAHMMQDFVGDADVISYWCNLKPEDRVVNIVYLGGPMTRNGDACSYGTKQLRDKIMRAADIRQCKGHIIVCDTPGGMAQSLQDMRLAINYAHSKGQSVYMLIDGQCASGGTFTSALCDKVFFVNPNDEIGSIGMYCAFFTLADGDKNSITSETYHEYYATSSTDKNSWYRQAANGDMSGVEADVEADLARLIANLRKDRPSIQDDQCTGKMYAMRDVVGTLVDGQSNVRSVAEMLLQDWEDRQGCELAPKEEAIAAPTSDTDAECKPKDDAECKPKDDTECKPKDDAECKPKTEEDAPQDEEPKDDPIDNNDGEGDNDGNGNGDDPEDDDPQGKCKPRAEEQQETTNQNQQTEMKQYTAIASAIGQEPMETLDGADLSLNAQLAEALEQHLSEEQTRESGYKDHVAMLEAEIESLKQKHADELAAQQDQHNAAIESLKAEHQTAIDEQAQQNLAAIEAIKAEHQTALDEQAAAMTAVQSQVADLTQRNSDLTAQVEQLNVGSGAQPNAGEQPATNGMQPQNPQVKAATAYDPRLSAAENAKRILAARKK